MEGINALKTITIELVLQALSLNFLFSLFRSFESGQSEKEKRNSIRNSAETLPHLKISDGLDVLS